MNAFRTIEVGCQPVQVRVSGMRGPPGPASGPLGEGSVTADTISNDPAEQAAIRTKLGGRQRLDIRDFGNVGVGGNDTAAFAAAFLEVENAGLDLYARGGTYIVDTLQVPNGHGFAIFGDGPGRTILQAAAPNQPILIQEQTDGAADDAMFLDFSLKAHAEGSNGPAFDTSGIRNGYFRRVMGLSEGAAGFDRLFRVSASPYLHYGTTWDKCGIAGQAGFHYAWQFDDGGGGAATNANAVRIINPWVYLNTGMIAGIDISECTGYEIAGGLVESAGDYGIILGSQGFVHNIWLESNAIAPLKFQNTASVFSAGNTLTQCYLSGFGGKIPIPAGCAGNIIQNCGISNTFVPADPADHTVFVGNPQGGEPVITQATGAPGALHKNSADVISNQDGTWLLTYDFTATAAGNYNFAISAPAGFRISKLIVACNDTPNGRPLVSVLAPTLAGFTVAIPDTAIFVISAQVGFQ
jgi:hypothetical protein